MIGRHLGGGRDGGGRRERWQALAGALLIAGAVGVFWVVSGCAHEDEEDCEPVSVRVFDTSEDTVQAPTTSATPLDAGGETCSVRVSLGGSSSGTVYLRLPDGVTLERLDPTYVFARRADRGLYEIQNVGNGETLTVHLSGADAGDVCYWGVTTGWDRSLGRWKEYHSVAAPVEFGSSVAAPAGIAPPGPGTDTARSSSGLSSASALFFWMTGGSSGIFTVDTDSCQRAVDFLQSGDVFFALRYPVGAGLRAGTGWRDPVVIRGNDRPELTMTVGSDTLVALPIETRWEWLPFANQRLPSASGEAWTVLGPQRAPRVVCPDGLDEWAWGTNLMFDLDLGTAASTYLDHVFEGYICYAGEEYPVLGGAAAASTEATVRADGVTCLGPFPLRAVDWYGGPDPPYLAWFSSNYSRVASGSHVELPVYLSSLASTPATLDVSFTSSLGLPWQLYAGTSSAPDLGSPITGPVSVEADGSAYVWLVADLPSGTTGWDTLRVTAVQDGTKPSWATHIVNIGPWTPPPVGVGWTSWVPVGSHATGSHGSQWRSDTGLFNPGFGAVTAEIRLHAGGEEHTVDVEVPGRGEVIVSDVVGAAGHSGAGPLEVSAPGELLVTSRSYNAIATGAECFPGGTLGQALDGLPVTDGLVAGQSAWIPQLVENDAFRSNIGLANSGSAPAEVSVHLYDGSGAELGSYAVSLGPGEWKQDNRPFANRAGRSDLDAAYAKVEVTSGAGIVAYGSVVDNLTNDPTTMATVLVPGAGSVESWIPVAVHAPGTNGSQWRTTVGLLNPGTTSANVTLRLYGPGGVASASYEVPGGSQVVLDDIAGGMGVEEAGPLRVSSTQRLVVTSRTYTRIASGAACMPGGTLGQALPGFTSATMMRGGQVAFIPHLVENTAFRSNLGFANTGDTTAQATVRLFDGSGTELASFEVGVPPHTWVQENRVFATRAGRGDLQAAWASVEITSGEGVIVYGSVVDNTTNDPTTVVPRVQL